MLGISNSGPLLQRSISPALNDPLAQELSTVLRADGPFVCRLKGKLKKLLQKGKTGVTSEEGVHRGRSDHEMMYPQMGEFLVQDLT